MATFLKAVPLSLCLVLGSATAIASATTEESGNDTGVNSVTVQGKAAYSPGSAAGNPAVQGGYYDCGLTVILSRWADNFDGDVFTSCGTTMASIEQTSTIYRSRWYGWEQMAQRSKTDFNTANSFLIATYNCARTGIHDFRVVGNGQVIPYGNNPGYASAYDEMTSQNCG